MKRTPAAIAKRTPAVLLALLLALLLAACMPLTASYLTVPVATRDGRPLALALVRVPLAELRRQMPRFDRARLAFYVQGREPIPHQLADDDGDGAADVAIVKLPIPAGGVLLTVVSPGPPAADELPPGGSAEGVVLRFDAARR